MPRKQISKDELKKHDKEKDCWVAINGLVIDCNKDILDEHPGGPDAILQLAGQEVGSLGGARGSDTVLTPRV